MEKRKLKVVLTSLAFPRRDLSPALVGLAECAKHDTTICQQVNFQIAQFQYRDDMDRIADDLCSKRGDVYGFSCYVWNIHECLKLAQIIKTRFPKAVVLLGGPEASGLSDYLIHTYRFVDYIIKGDGEESFTKFLLYLLHKTARSEVPGLVCLNRAGETLFNPNGSPPDIHRLPSPYAAEDYLDYLDNCHEPVTVTFETTRGCPFRCRYCCWGSQRVRFHSLDRVQNDLERLLSHPAVGRIYITDSDIFLNKKRGKMILKFLLNKNYRNIPVIFEVNPEILDEETTRLIAQFHEDEFAFGLQSSSPSVLESINRRFNPLRYKENITRLKRYNPDIRIWFSLIIGLPGDCLTTFKESLAFAISMEPSSLYIHEFLCLPGSEFFDAQEKYGILCQKEAPHKLLYHRTFGKRDYLKAKELGFYTSLFHNYRFIKEPLYSLWHTSGTKEWMLLHYYERLMEFTRFQIDLTEGKSIKEIPSFLFDEYYQRITSNRILTNTLRSIFYEFYEMLEKEKERNSMISLRGIDERCALI
jgi:radical SAM superfamily enzyme YgiQ (UPF0313 family)